jgi:hypothetical protein
VVVYYARQSLKGTSAIMYMVHFFQNYQYLVQPIHKYLQTIIVQQIYLYFIESARVVLVASRLEGDIPQVFNILSSVVQAGLVRAHEGGWCRLFGV